MNEELEVLCDAAADWKADYMCPHCRAEYSSDDIEDLLINTTDYHIYKDPYFCEASGSATFHYKCKKCGGLFYEDRSWDF